MNAVGNVGYRSNRFVRVLDVLHSVSENHDAWTGGMVDAFTYGSHPSGRKLVKLHELSGDEMSFVPFFGTSFVDRPESNEEHVFIALFTKSFASEVEVGANKVFTNHQGKGVAKELWKMVPVVCFDDAIMDGLSFIGYASTKSSMDVPIFTLTFARLRYKIEGQEHQ